MVCYQGIEPINSSGKRKHQGSDIIGLVPASVSDLSNCNATFYCSGGNLYVRWRDEEGEIHEQQLYFQAESP